MILEIRYVYHCINQYINRVYKAIINKPIHISNTITKEVVVYKPFNKEQIEYLESLFKLPVYTQGITMEEMAYNTGKYEVVQFIKQWSARGGLNG